MLCLVLSQWSAANAVYLSLWEHRLNISIYVQKMEMSNLFLLLCTPLCALCFLQCPSWKPLLKHLHDFVLALYPGISDLSNRILRLSWSCLCSLCSCLSRKSFLNKVILGKDHGMLILAISVASVLSCHIRFFLPLNGACEPKIFQF